MRRLTTLILSGALALACQFTAAVDASDTLIPKGAQWKYLDDGSNQGTAWRGPLFEDGGWASGPGELGFGDRPANPEATLINNHNGGASTESLTWYFRHTFNVDDPGQYSGFEIELRRDDGAVVYLNGNEIFRSHMPAGTISYATPASSPAVGGSDETSYFKSHALCNTLEAGENVLAVEVHQNNAGSSDISFDLALKGTNPTEVTRGPYLQNQTPDSIVVRWRTLCPSSSRVSWGDAVDNLTNVADDASSTTEHEITLANLTPGSTVYYSVGSTTAEMQGNDANHFFVMPPAHGAEIATRVWVLGDSGTANGDARAVRDAYNTFTGATHTNLWLMLGDNAYKDGTDQEYQDAVFDTYPDMLRKSTLWPTVGNHDDRSADSITGTGVYYDIFTLPHEAAAGGAGTGVDSGTEAYYSFDYANIHFVVLESDETNGTFRSAMESWLAADLAATTAVWVVAFWHHPPYTMGSHNSDIETRHIYMRQIILPILEAGGVDIELGGHSHSYERSWLIDGHHGNSDSFDALTHVLDDGDGAPAGDGPYRKQTPGQTPNLGAVHVVAGSSGKVSGSDRNAPHEAMRNAMPLEVLGSVVLDVSGNTMDVTFLTNAGTVSDSFRIEKEYDADGVPDASDNCPNVANSGQENLDGDEFGNACDVDVDGDGVANDVDQDDDNDGLSDVAEEEAGSYAFNPDSDGDGIRDGLDASPTVADTFCSGDTASIDQDIDGPAQCAAPVKVVIESGTDIIEFGRLLIVTPTSELMPGFSVLPGGELTIFSEPLP